MIRDEIVLEIGQLIMRAANNTHADWAYAGYVYSTADGRNSSRLDFLFRPDMKRDFLEDRPFVKDIRTQFSRLWQVATDDDENHFVACKAIVRAADRDFKILFEFDNINRWAVGPSNVAEAPRLFLADVYPEALT